MQVLRKSFRLPGAIARRGLITSIISLSVVVAAGCGAGGGSTAVNTPSTPPASTPPPPPSTATHSVTLSWSASKSPQVTGYFVYRRSANDPNYSLLNPSSTASVTYVDLDVQAGQSLVYEVTAVDGHLRESKPSEEVQVTIPQ